MDPLRESFGRLAGGEAVEAVTLRSATGFEARILSYGATLQRLVVADREGRREDVVLGHDELEGYVATRGYFGATVGRYANRIASGRFVLDGREVRIAPNDGPNALHGGADGFDRQLWRIAGAGGGDRPFVRLERRSADGEGGFPGALDVSVTYRIAGDETLEIAMEAVAEAATVVNLTNHTFFNLGGAAPVRPVLDHRIAIEADRFLPVDTTAIPEGSPADVAGTPFDLREPRPIGLRLRDAQEQILRGRGYDHCFCLRGEAGGEPRPAARVEDPATGRVLELLSDQPGLQFYSGNFLDGTVAGKGGQAYRMGDAFCLEPQLYPDTPNRPDFPTARIEAGGRYRHRIVYCFSTN